MFTSRQSTLKCDVVLFVERSGELFYMARLNTKRRYEAEARASLKRAKKSYEIDPKPSDLSMSRLKLE